MVKRKLVDILGIDIDNVSLLESLQIIEKFLQDKESCKAVFTPNSHIVMLARKDIRLYHALKSANLLIPDGMPLIWGSKFLNTPLKEKISGSSYLYNLCEYFSTRRQVKLFLLGGFDDVANKTKEILISKYKNISVLGTYSPPIGFFTDYEENEKIIKILQNSGAEILIVGLSEGVGEKWIIKYKDKYKIPISIQLGAAFDFITGIKKMPPQFLKNIGLGWLWRLLHEPKRLFKRYIFCDSPIFYMFLMQQLHKLEKK